VQNPATSRGRGYNRTLVDYEGLATARGWQPYMERIRHADAARVRAAPEADRKAFWINTHNALVIDSVLKAYPLKEGEGIEAIKDIRTRYHAVAGKGTTLDEIEALLLRMNDPRVALALCAGTKGSPPLYEQAFAGGAVDAQLDRAADFFCADPGNVRFDRARNELRLSPVFRDRAGLFLSGVLQPRADLRGYTPEERAALSFILPRIDPNDMRGIVAASPRIVYNKPDQLLNDAGK
jgi:hypothetical protein